MSRGEIRRDHRRDDHELQALRRTGPGGGARSERLLQQRRQQRAVHRRVRAPTTAPASADTGTPAPSAMTAPEPATGSITLQGAGATFPDPLYEVWFQSYNEKYSNVQIDYQSIGSGGGIKAITEGTVDFGASDAPMKDEELAALPAGSKMVHFPTALGAVVVIYNLPGVDGLAARRRQRRRHLPRHDQEVERSGDRREQQRRDPAGHRHPRRPPVRRLGHDERLHDLPRYGLDRLARQGRQGQGSELADRRRRPGQRRRGRSGQADRREPSDTSS